MPKEMITISKEEYESLEEYSQFYHALVAAGVDNWVGYDLAIEIKNEWIDEN